MVPEWRIAYCNYKLLKEMLGPYKIVAKRSETLIGNEYF